MCDEFARTPDKTENINGGAPIMTVFKNDLGGDYYADRFINQFILGPAFVESLTGWNRVSVDDALKLTAHPGLDVEQVEDGGKSITIVGYILDPKHPTTNNIDIATALMEKYGTLDQLLRATEELGGRWVLIARDGGKTVLFSDALGSRQVFFTTAGFEHGFWAMSQPGLLAWLLKLQVDDNAIAYLDAYEIRSAPEYKWPAAASAFRGIRRLLPNHYLDTGAAKERRYWPLAPLSQTSLEEGLEQAVCLLEGLVDAAYWRFDLVHGVTAGYDSRTALAAARKYRERIQTISVRRAIMPDNHHDLVVPARLLDKLNIPHEIIKASPSMSGEFSKAFKENVFLAHDHYGQVAEAILNRFSRRKAVMTGNGAEVVKTCYRNRIDANKSQYTGEELSRVNYMGNHEFTVKYFSEWQQGVGDPYNVPVLDLLVWEHMDGSWLAAVQQEYDYAWREVFTPFNCRTLLTCLLSIDERYRKKPDFIAFRSLIEMMWPELLAEPFNPEAEAKITRLPRTLWRSTKRTLKRYIVR